jgi:hypothetical protein
LCHCLNGHKMIEVCITFLLPHSPASGLSLTHSHLLSLYPLITELTDIPRNSYSPFAKALTRLLRSRLWTLPKNPLFSPITIYSLIASTTNIFDHPIESQTFIFVFVFDIRIPSCTAPTSESPNLSVLSDVPTPLLPVITRTSHSSSQVE